MMIIKNHDIGELYFGQLHPLHQNFFNKLYGSHTRIPLRQLPHYKFWIHDEWKNPKKSLYYQYLNESWKFYQPNNNSPQDKLHKIEAYTKTYEDIKNNGVEKPITIVEALDGEKIIVSGNHRASICYALGIDLPCETMSVDEYINDVVQNQDEFYGTKNKDTPYQSIFYKEKELIKGRRRDVYERFQKMNIIEDIRGKTVLDAGSNIAVNAMFAWQFGAANVTAAEISPKIGMSALRLSTLLNSPITVVVQDMGEPFKIKDVFDTVFCFSLHAHVKDKKTLEKNLATKTGSTLYFEGHERSQESDYNHIFRHFNSVELIGHNQDGVHSDKSSRPFFRCTK